MQYVTGAAPESDGPSTAAMLPSSSLKRWEYLVLEMREVRVVVLRLLLLLLMQRRDGEGRWCWPVHDRAAVVAREGRNLLVDGPLISEPRHVRSGCCVAVDANLAPEAAVVVA